MIRRLLIALASACMLIPLTSAPADAVDTRWYRFNWCNVYQSGLENIHICSGIVLRRQNDGQGLLIDSLSHYLDITTDKPFTPDPDDCSPDVVYQDPAAKNNHTEIDAEQLDGSFIDVKFATEAPNGNLNGANGCYAKWTFSSLAGGDLNVGAQRVESDYNFYLRLKIVLDHTAGNSIDIWVASDGSLHSICHVNDRCNRTIL